MESKRQLIIIGAGGHGRVIADIARANQSYSAIAFLDDAAPKEDFPYPYFGLVKEATHFVNEADFVVGIGNNTIRRKIQEWLRAPAGNFATLVHPSAIIGSKVSLGEGTVVMPNAVINTGCRIGAGCIVNTAATVDHDCTIGDYCHLSPGVHLCGTVSLGNDSWIGAGAVVINNVNICAEVMVAAGSTVIHSLESRGVYMGTPAILHG